MSKLKRAIYSDGKTYLVGDIVEITYETCDSNDIFVDKTVCGRIKTIYDNSIDIDCSEKFEAHRISIDIVCVTDIELVGRESEKSEV